MPLPWSAKFRPEDINKISGKEYDLIIIGGGITGAGIARECALRGISFCLLEKNDFAFGTSSRSSKLFHGGLRYLNSGHFKLVRESTSERNWLRCHFPNLVRPLAFVYPSYRHSKVDPLKLRLGMLLYNLASDCFSEYKNYRKGKVFRAKFIEELEPAVTLEDPDLGRMTIAGFYYDTNCDDARATVETIRESLERGKERSAALNYVRVTGFTRDGRGQVDGVLAKDQLGGRKFSVRGRCVVSATGIWTDQLLAMASLGKPRIYPTKGVHVVVPTERLGNRHAVTHVSPDDGRIFFVLPRGRVSVIGTTDTAYYPESKNLDAPRCNRADCDYLLRAVNQIFPHAMLTDNDIIATYAGIRPLVIEEGAKTESDVSRDHEIFETEDGIVAIAGGKSTTFRLMAEELIFYLDKKKYLKPYSNPGHGRRGYSKQPFTVGLTRNEFDQIAAEKKLLHAAHPDQVEYFYTQYGRKGIAILETIKEKPGEGIPLLEGYPHCKAEIMHILEFENAPKLIDILARRTEAQWTIWHYRQEVLANAVASIMAEYYNWNKVRKDGEIQTYLEYVKENVRFLEEARNNS